MKLHTLILSACLVAGCASSKSTTMPTPPPGAKTATATLEKKSGSQVEGTAQFVEENGQVTMTMKLKNLTAGPHAVHLHEKGDCSAADASSAGPHWNPGGEAHGMWGHPPHHMGDIGNVDIAQDGTGTVTLTTDKWSIGGDPSTNIIGHSVVVHANADDFSSQPAGNAGGRVACGVITQ